MSDCYVLGIEEGIIINLCYKWGDWGIEVNLFDKVSKCCNLVLNVGYLILEFLVFIFILCYFFDFFYLRIF